MYKKNRVQQNNAGIFTGKWLWNIRQYLVNIPCTMAYLICTYGTVYGDEIIWANHKESTLSSVPRLAAGGDGL